MSGAPHRAVLCRECGRQLTEEPDGQPRLPCPACGATAREYQAAGSLLIRVTDSATGSATGSVVIQAPPAAAEAAAPTPRVSVEAGIEAGTFTRTVIFSQTPGAWVAEVRKPDGEIVGIEVAFDAQDVFLLLDEHLLPSGSY